MDFGKVIANPVVIGGGALLGLVMLLSKGGSNGAAPADHTTEYLSAAVAMNANATQAQMKDTEARASLGAAQISADTAKQANILAYMSNADANRTVVDSQRIQSQTGIIQSQIAADTAIITDINQNNNRLAMAQVEAYKEIKVATIQTNGAVAINDRQVNGQKRASTMGAITGVVGSIAKTVGSIFGL